MITVCYLVGTCPALKATHVEYPTFGPTQMNHVSPFKTLILENMRTAFIRLAARITASECMFYPTRERSSIYRSLARARARAPSSSCT